MKKKKRREDNIMKKLGKSFVIMALTAAVLTGCGEKSTDTAAENKTNIVLGNCETDSQS